MHSLNACATSRLPELLELADQGPALRAALAEEVAETSDRLARRLSAGHARRLRSLAGAGRAGSAMPRFVPDCGCGCRADPALAALVLPPEDCGRTLIETARARRRYLRGTGARAQSAPRPHQRYSVRSQRPCPGDRLQRPGPVPRGFLGAGDRDERQERHRANYARLDAYDAVERCEAARLLRGWRDNDVAERAA